MSAVKRIASPCHCINARRVSSLISDLYDRHLRPTGLSISQYSLLANLEGFSTASISELAAQVGLDRTTLVRNLKPLMERGLIRDLAEPGRRNRQLTLTAEGQALLDQGRVLWKNAQAELNEKLGEENIRVFKTMLRQMQE